MQVPSGSQGKNPFQRLTDALLSDHNPEDRSHPSSLRQEITREIVTLHARVLLHMPVIQLLFVAGAGGIVLPSVPLRIFLLWGLLTVGTEGLRGIFAWWVLPRVDVLSPKRLHAVFMILDALAGGMVGLSAILFLHRLPLLSQVLIEIVLFAIAAAGVSVAVSSKYMLAAYSFLVLLEASISWVLLHPEHGWTVAGLTLLYWIFLIGVASESERLLERSVRIRQERDRILATASHDLRQPLHALSVYSAVLASSPTETALREIGKNIDHIVQELGGMLNGLLDLSKLSTGGYRLQRQIMLLDQTVAGVCAEFMSAAAEKGVTIRQTLVPVRMTGDSLAVARIARNLIDNAIKFTDRGEVHIGMALSENGGVILSVTDTGRGIAPAEQGLVFEEFYQAGSPGRDRGKGVGLGLSIVRRLATMMEADVTVRSVVGKGSCFQVNFPGPVFFSQTFPVEPDQGGGARFLEGVRVVVVDDSPEIRKGMGTLLTLWGAEARSCATPGEAEALLGEGGAPDLLIADLRLEEGINGAEMALRLQKTFGPFPVLIITGETSPHCSLEIPNPDFVLLKKPIPEWTLQEAIGEILARSRKP